MLVCAYTVWIINGQSFSAVSKVFSLIRELTGVQAGAENIVRRKIFFFSPLGISSSSCYLWRDWKPRFIYPGWNFNASASSLFPILGFTSIWHMAESLKETWDRRTVAITPIPTLTRRDSCQENVWLFPLCMSISLPLSTSYLYIVRYVHMFIYNSGPQHSLMLRLLWSNLLVHCEDMSLWLV